VESTSKMFTIHHRDKYIYKKRFNTKKLTVNNIYLFIKILYFRILYIMKITNGNLIHIDNNL